MDNNDSNEIAIQSNDMEDGIDLGIKQTLILLTMKAKCFR